MNQLHDHAALGLDSLVPVDSNAEFVARLQELASALNADINHASTQELQTVVGLGVCSIQMDGTSTCVVTDQVGKSVSPAIRMVSAILSTCLRDESDERILLLLNKAHKLTEQALKIRTGEILSSTLH